MRPLAPLRCRALLTRRHLWCAVLCCAATTGSTWATDAVARLQPVVAQKQEKLKEEMLGKLKDLGNMVLGKFGLCCDNFKLDKDPNSGGYSIRFER